MPVRLPSVVLFMIQSIDSRERMPDVVHPCIACVAGVRRGGKAGERPRVKRDWEDRTFLPFYGLPRRLTVALLQTGLETILSFHLLPRPPIQSCCTVPLPEWWALLGFPPYFDMMFHRLSRYIESNAFRCTELYFIRWLVPVHSWEWKSDRWYFCSLQSLSPPSSRCCQRLFLIFSSTLCRRSRILLMTGKSVIVQWTLTQLALGWKWFWTAGIQMKWRCDRRNCQLKFKELQILARKKFQLFNGIRTYGLCVCAAVPYQLSYEDPHIGSRPISEGLSSSLNPWQELHIEWKWFWTAGIQTDEIKMWSSPNMWVFIAQLVEHCSVNAEAMGSNPVEALKFFLG